VVVLIGAVLIAAVGCASAADGTAEAEEFATSGSAEADQRAEQVMAKEAQAEGADDDDTENKSKTLYARLGGEEGVKTIVDDAVDRVLVDPRVNVTRDGIGGGFFSSGPKTLEVNNSNTSEIKKHVAAFIALAAGGPAAYDGPEIRSAFAEREFSNIEFDAAVGCLQATLDKLAVADQEQRELLAIIETTREQVVEVR
jgi:hemoglobin